MSAVWAWVRLDLRGRVRSLVVLALLVAVTTGVVLTATAGARRGDTAVPRLRDRTLPATVAALPNQPGFDWDAVAGLPNVEAIGRFAVADIQADELPEGGINFPYGDGTMVDIERPVVLEGRRADPSRPDEGVITAAFEGTTGLGVGDTITLHLLTREQADEQLTSDAPAKAAGPTIESTIVGVVRSPWFSDTGDSEQGTFVASTALLEQYEESFIGSGEGTSINALIRLRGGAASVPQFREDLAELTGRRDIEFFDLAGDAAHAQEVAGFEANALLAFAFAALVAAMFLVGQSVIRLVASSSQDLRVLSAVGMSPRQVRIAASAGPALAAMIGTAVGVIGAYVASSRFPIGTAQPIEPSPGRHVDLVVLLTGLVAIPLLVTAGAAVASWATVRAEGGSHVRRSPLVNVVARAGAPIPVTVGTSFALDRGRGSQSVPVYPALIGAVVGVVGVVAALTFANGVTDATNHPERFGQISQLQSFIGFSSEDFADPTPVIEVLAGDPEVVAVNDTRQGVLESGAVDMAAFVIDPFDEPPPIVVLEGGLASEPDEVMIATKTASKLGARVGDTIELAGSRSSGDYTVAGIVFVPEGSHNEYDEGAWILPTTYDELIEGFKFHTLEVTLADGADADAVAARLGGTVAETMGFPREAGAEIVEVRTPPSRLQEIKQIQRLPLFLAGFLALLAVGAVGHALASAVRRRRHDLAVLRVVGVTRRQCRASVLVQAAVLAMVGLTFGVPLGFVLGRVLWRSVADSTPMDYIPPVAVWALVLIGPVVLLAALLLAAWPSHRAVSPPSAWPRCCARSEGRATGWGPRGGPSYDEPMPVATPIAATDEQLDLVQYDAAGLVPAIVQEEGTGAVLMMAWMNAETLRMSLTEGRTVFWSRSRQEVWRKGDTSGDRQFLRQAFYDCDADALLLVVEQEGRGACHTGERSCFHRAFG